MTKNAQKQVRIYNDTDWNTSYLTSLTKHIAKLCKVTDVSVRFDEGIEVVQGESHWPDDKGFNFKRIHIELPPFSRLTNFQLILALTHEMFHVAEMQYDPNATQLEWSFRKKGRKPHNKRPEELRVNYKTVTALMYDQEIEEFL